MVHLAALNLRVEMYEIGVAIRTGTSKVGLAGPDNQDGKCKRHPPRAPVGVSLWYQGPAPLSLGPLTRLNLISEPNG